MQMHFGLKENVYAAQYDENIIILDANTNLYSSIINPGAEYLSPILNTPFIKTEAGFVPAAATEDSTFNEWVESFMSSGFIDEVDAHHKVHQKQIVSSPQIKGGLVDYQWDSKTGWSPLKHTSILTLVKTWWQLVRVTRTMKKNGIGALLDRFKLAKSKQRKVVTPTKKRARSSLHAVDAATLFYPKKTYCLAWASTFVLEAIKKGWACNLVIGVQVNPFYAHAWVEHNGMVIHDDSKLPSVLACILREPFN